MQSKTTKSLTLALFRNDLRIHDNPIISYAHLPSIKEGDSTRRNKVSDYFLPLYVFDESQVELSGLEGYQRKGPPPRTDVCGFWRTGCHRLSFLCESVYGLQEELKKRGSDLLIRFGVVENTTVDIIKQLQQDGYSVDQVYLTKEVAHEEIETEKRLKNLLAQLNPKVSLTYFHSKSLIHPEDLPFKIKEIPDVYTPFRSKVESLPAHKLCRPLLPLPTTFLPFPSLSEKILNAKAQPGYSGSLYHGESRETVVKCLMKPLLDDPDVNEDKKDPVGYETDERTAFPYKGGETEALKRLARYFFQGQDSPVRTYKSTRNGLLGEEYSTKFSPFLALGCLSPRKIIHSLRQHEAKFGSNKDTYWVLFEVLWRDYFIFITQKYGSALFKLQGFEGVLNPKSANQKTSYWKPFKDARMNQSKNRNPPVDRNALAWLKGETGVPFLDANLIELTKTGFMSNRGRQNVASFLTKDLGLDWRIGAEFFESQLLDYDPCSNYGNWQYVAGVGNDPRTSRQFNPIKQAKDYDPQGNYVKCWLPALEHFPVQKVHTPWILSHDEQEKLMSKGSHKSYPRKPILEQQSWKKHYQRR
ncbi:hypothetical protein O181_033414 [Austropuccinia psidii MF-1]|uniref:Cryptochrome DASH n=1 Tax=Austropuccinia psidii MF-1 TaxID=1389203 RepID=A0A9Q3CZ66_9BASI|nr:hypothetical protein [Austropuccinia psidii MF-1]